MSFMSVITKSPAFRYNAKKSPYQIEGTFNMIDEDLRFKCGHCCAEVSCENILNTSLFPLHAFNAGHIPADRLSMWLESRLIRKEWKEITYVYGYVKDTEYLALDTMWEVLQSDLSFPYCEESSHFCVEILLQDIIEVDNIPVIFMDMNSGNRFGTNIPIINYIEKGKYGLLYECERCTTIHI